MLCRRYRQGLALGLVLGLLVMVLPAGQAPPEQGHGSGRHRVGDFSEVQVQDGTVATLTLSPTSSDPGPRAAENTDRFRFRGGHTNTKAVVFLSIPTATNAADASTVTVQGTTHAITDWFFLRQDDAGVFGTVSATGAHDADAGGYIAPSGFTQSSQGTLVLRTYDRDASPDGGTPFTFYWIYDADRNEYRFDTDQDLSDGATKVYPTAVAKRNQYLFTHLGLQYAVTAVGGAGAHHVPTVQLAWHTTPAAYGGDTWDAYPLIDIPSGAPRDGYDFVVQATVEATH